MVDHSHHKLVRILTGGMLALLLAGGTVQADDTEVQELRARMERVEKQNEELRQMLQSLRPKSGHSAGAMTEPTMLEEADASASEGKDKTKSAGKEEVKKLVNDYLKTKDEEKKKEEEKKKKEEEEKWYEVGKNTDFKLKWDHGLWAETADKAFRVHVGGRTQFDAVWVDTSDPVSFGRGGIGVYDDALNFRRARLAVEGTFWEVFDFNCEYDFLNTVRIIPAGNVVPAQPNNVALVSTAGTVNDRANVINTPVPTDVWITWTKLPIVGNIRVGNQKPRIAFEHMTSSRFLDFMERSLAFDAFVERGNNGFNQGITAFNTVFDERATWAIGLYKNNQRIFGWNVGDGETQVTGRVTALPWYCDEGRYLLHVGLGGQISGSDDGQLRYRTRPMLRNGPAVLHNTIGIVQFQGDNERQVVPEVALVVGPWSMSAEYYGLWARNTGRVLNAGNISNPAGLANRGDLFFQGGYVEVGYFLTGESRTYDRKNPGWARQIPYESAFAVDAEDCGCCWGRGAWQTVVRGQWIDLDNRGVNGGTVYDVTAGLNWFLNPNAKVQWNYTWAYRNAQGNTSDGVIQGIGTRLAFDF